jgi:hypothetical protein
MTLTMFINDTPVLLRLPLRRALVETCGDALMTRNSYQRSLF